MDPDQGGFIEGPKNLALALVAFELAWVDAGAATGSLAGNLALAPIHERGTPEQRDTYIADALRPAPAGREPRDLARGAFALTEPLPYVGVETGCSAARSGSPSGRTARSRSCRSTSAGASSPTWASPTSSRPPWTPPTRGSREVAW